MFEKTIFKKSPSQMNSTIIISKITPLILSMSFDSTECKKKSYTQV